MWLIIWRLTTALRQLPPPLYRSIAKIMWGCGRFGTTRPHYAVRALALGLLSDDFGKRLVVGPGVYVIGPERLRLGDDVSINHLTYIDATGGIDIGTGTRIGNHVTIVSGNHDMTKKEIQRDAIRVGSSVWIGAGCRILAGVVIGNDAIVGAGSVVNKSVSSGVTVGGVPAKPLRLAP